MRSALFLVVFLLPTLSIADEQPKQQAVQPAPNAERSYRFDMSQNGKKMTAEEFDAWMQSQGIRVATGKKVSDAHAPAPATAVAAAPEATLECPKAQEKKRRVKTLAC